MKRYFILLLVFVFLFSGCVQNIEQRGEEMSGKQITLEALGQYPSLPTGCEVTAAATVLCYLGENITPESFASEWLTRDENFYYRGEALYGPDPYKVFVGDPFKKNSYGCFAPVIANAVSENSRRFSASVIKEKTVAELCCEYIDRDSPIIIWVTMSMKPSSTGSEWYLENGNTFTWTAGEHCMVLCGYDEKYYYLADSESASIVLYEKTLVEKRFQELGSQAVYIYPK